MADPVQIHIPFYPGNPEIGGQTVEVEDTPILRAQLEQHAIPKCREWREANPEECTMGAENDDTRHSHPAPYCCSAYCLRCNGLRALNGDEPLRPNEWMIGQ